MHGSNMTPREVSAALVLAEQGLLLSMDSAAPKRWRVEHRIRNELNRVTLITARSSDEAFGYVRHVSRRPDETVSMVPVQL